MLSKGTSVRRAQRRKVGAHDSSIIVNLDDRDADWHPALDGCESVVHLASRVHVLNDSTDEPLVAFRDTNVNGTLNLARQALTNNIKRFIFISSIGVNGAETLGAPYNQNDFPTTPSPYAISKYEAELGLHAVFEGSGVEVTIIRAPAIYGVNAPGNFGLVETFIKKGLPLPFASIENKRSLLALDNLVDLIYVCLRHPAAPNQTFLASDGNDLSTPEVIAIMGALVGKSPKLGKMPPAFIKILFSLVKKRQSGQSLLGNLQIDSSSMFELLDWTPPFNPRSFLKKMKES